MSNERKLIDYINETYRRFEEQGKVFDNVQKMLFETGVATGIIFALTNLIDTKIDVSVLAQYSPETIDKDE
jgi:hypothetical protein